MGMQSIADRQLDISGVFTTAATATFIFLVGDVANGPVTGEDLRRLVGVLLGLFFGATARALLFCLRAELRACASVRHHSRGNTRFFASRHAGAPFHPSCPPKHEIPDSLVL